MPITRHSCPLNVHCSFGGLQNGDAQTVEGDSTEDRLWCVDSQCKI
jgi:hypothetical protein